MTPPVVVFEDPEPNGLAAMLGGLVQANLAADPGRARLLAKPAAFTLEAVDAGVAATLTLRPGEVRVANGVGSGSRVHVRADSATLLDLSRAPLRFGLPDVASAEGRAVIGKLVRRQLRIRGLLTGAAVLGRVGLLLSVR